MSLFNRRKKTPSGETEGLGSGTEKLPESSGPEKNGLFNRINPFAKKDKALQDTATSPGDDEQTGLAGDLPDQLQPCSEQDDVTPGKQSSAKGEQPEDGQSPAKESSKPRFGFLQRFKQGLSKTRENLAGKIQELVKNTRKLDEDFWEELEEILIQADVGMNTSVELVEKIRQAAKKQHINDANEVLHLIQQEIALLLQNTQPLNLGGPKPAIIMVVGVNGAGKTTSIAKLAYRFKQEGLNVLLAAADTFRAAAIDQLQIWADRVGVELIKHREGSDPGAVVFDAISAARARSADILIIDTAGRLQNKTNLMRELSKVRKIIEREIGQDPQEVLLVLDATTGQNAISQARIFQEATGVTGIVLTKLDGTAKGGIVLAIARELDIPVKLIGIGETLDDLRDFDPNLFAQALFDNDNNNNHNHN
ncbi:MAG: signal recognition particle-docking protein FtsY [Syntrophomonadaceae bacterium]|nr:signal recognition particle-docking protein FtsY [Syntrophomonadaceae bacterium]